MRTALLVLVGLFVTAAAVLTAASLRRRDGVLGLAGMTTMVVAAIPATVYATITS